MRMKYQKINNIITLSGESVQGLQFNYMYLPLSVKVLSSREAKTLMSLKKEWGNISSTYYMSMSIVQIGIVVCWHYVVPTLSQT